MWLFFITHTALKWLEKNKEAGTKSPSLLLFPNIALECAPKVWISLRYAVNPKPTFATLPFIFCCQTRLGLIFVL